MGYTSYNNSLFLHSKALYLYVFQTGSISSLASLDELSETDRLRRKLEDIEADRQRLQKQVKSSLVKVGFQYCSILTQVLMWHKGI